MQHPFEKRFEDFFEEDNYVALKNHLYNYLVRRRIVQAAVRRHRPERILEVGSGLSPMMTTGDRVVFSELSHRALRTMKAHHGNGLYIVADGTRLPFPDATFSHTVCSEVLEHVEDDQRAVAELARVMKPAGRLCLTVPHRRFYFAADDRFVQHFRRYELGEIEAKLAAAGLDKLAVKKVLGPLEKITMLLAVPVFKLIQRFGSHHGERPRKFDWIALVLPAFKWGNRLYALLARLDAALLPRALSTVIFLEAQKAETHERKPETA